MKTREERLAEHFRIVAGQGATRSRKQPTHKTKPKGAVGRARNVSNILSARLQKEFNIGCTSCFQKTLTDLDKLSITQIREKSSDFAKAIGENVAEMKAKKVGHNKKLQQWIGSYPSSLDAYERLILDACDEYTIKTPKPEPNSFRMIRPFSQIIGTSYHRTGWPYCCDALDLASSSQGILLEDFVEHRFCYAAQPQPIEEPWIGIFHHPPDMPSFAREIERPEVYIKTEAFQKSLPFLKGAITLSNHLAKKLRCLLPVTVETVLMPFPNEPSFSPEEFRNTQKKLVQVGWYQRNTQALLQVPNLPDWRKIQLLKSSTKSIKAWDETVKNQSPWKERRIYDQEIIHHDYLSNAKYDELLRSSVFITEAFAASACNGIGDCISTATPILCNRLPSFIEYLGEDYPGYFDSPGEIPYLLTNQHIEQIHQYLLRMDRTWMTRAKLVATVKHLAKQANEPS